MEDSIEPVENPKTKRCAIPWQKPARYCEK